MNKQTVRTQKVCEILKALGHPTRIIMLEGLLKNECNVAQIQKNLGLPQSTISQHLRLLRNYGIIRSRQEGTKRCYQVIDTRIEKILQIIKGC